MNINFTKAVVSHLTRTKKLEVRKRMAPTAKNSAPYVMKIEGF